MKNKRLSPKQYQILHAIRGDYHLVSDPSAKRAWLVRNKQDPGERVDFRTFNALLAGNHIEVSRNVVQEIIDGDPVVIWQEWKAVPLPARSW